MFMMELLMWMVPILLIILVVCLLTGVISPSDLECMSSGACPFINGSGKMN